MRAQTLARETVLLTNWFSQWLASCAHSSSPFQRKVTALELLSILVSNFSGPDSAIYTQPLLEAAGLGDAAIESHLFSQMNCEILFNCLWDKFEIVRGLAHSILLRAPAPIPAYETPTRLIRLLEWSLKILNSPRTRDCDSGANALRVIVQKYIREAHWSIRFQVDAQTGSIAFDIAPFTDSVEGHLLDFFDDMLNFLEAHLKFAQSDLKRAALANPIHGPLMAVRYLFGDTDLSKIELKARWELWIARFITLVRGVGAIAYAQSICYKIGEENNDSSIGSEPAGDDTEDAGGDSMGYDIVGHKPELQLVVVMAWLCAKEVHFALGSIAKAMLPSGCEEPLHSLVSLETLVSLGDYILENSLLRLKHVGAIETASDGFQLICEAFLRSRIKSLHNSPRRWIDLMLHRIQHAPHGLLLTRRSAGLPVAFVAMLRGEVLAMRDRRSNVLLSFAMAQLLTICQLPENQTADPDNRKQVHSLNVIRHIIRDKVLVDDVGAFVEDVLMTVIRLYASSQWHVKNSATMVFSTLLERCLGDKQRGTVDAHSRAVASVSCAEFFARFPAVLPFLLRQLDESTASMRSASKDQVKVSDYLSPAAVSEISIHATSSGLVQSPSSTSLYAIMALLSRFAPARLQSAQHLKSSTAFVPYVVSCVNSADFHVRVMAARALAPLIATEDVPSTISRLVSVSAGSHDHQHGIFLQIQCLLRCHHRHLTMDDERRSSLTALGLVPLRSVLKFVTSLPCSPISCVILRTPQIAFRQTLSLTPLLAEILLEFVVHEVPKLQENEIRAQLLPLYQETFGIAARIVFPPVEASADLGARLRTDIMYFKLREVAASIVSHIVLNPAALCLAPTNIGADVDADAFVIGMIEDQQYEVRVVALRALRAAQKSVGSPNFATIDSSVLQLALLSHLGIDVGTSEGAFIETHALCVELTVKLLNKMRGLALPARLLHAAVSSLQSTAGSQREDIWSRLEILFNDEKASVTIRGGAFMYMGSVIHQLCKFLPSSSFASSPDALKSVANFVLLPWVNACLRQSAIDQTVDWRQFVVDSVCASDLSHIDIPNTDDSSARSSWETVLIKYCQVVIRLVQDDDLDLRSSMTLLVARLVAADTGSPVVDINVSRSTEFLFEYVSSRFGSDKAAMELLVFQLSSLHPGECASMFVILLHTVLTRFRRTSASRHDAADRGPRFCPVRSGEGEYVHRHAKQSTGCVRSCL